MKAARPLIFLCLSLMILISAGSYFGFRILQKQVRSEMKLKIKRGISETEMTTLTFSKNGIEQLNWIKDDEFVYNGLIYDVIKITEGNAAVTFHVISDKKEKELFDGLTEMVDQDLAEGKSSGKRTKLLKLLSFKFLPASFIVVSPADPLASSSCAANSPASNAGFTSLWGPPPEFS